MLTRVRHAVCHQLRAVLALLRGESLWRSARHESPDRARRLWGPCQLTELAPAAVTRPRSAVRAPEWDSRRSNANTCDEPRLEHRVREPDQNELDRVVAAVDQRQRERTTLEQIV